MSTQPNTPAPAQSTANKILDAIAASGSLISIAVPIAGTLIPIVVSVVKSIEGVGAAQTIEYSLVVQQDQAALDAIIAAGTADLATINAELVRMGMPPLITS